MTSADPALVRGRYRLGPMLGEGAMATVSRATHEVLRRDVAIKMLKPIFAGDPAIVERFYVEARAVAALAHPHIVALYAVLDDAPGDAIVMEFVDGGSLAEKLKAEGALPEADVVRYAHDIASALESAHQRGILHRDIKPANVLIGVDGSVKVADFGLAKALAETDIALTHAGRLVGSAHYFSPEQAQGLPLTPASDLYSLGVTIYQLVTGNLPFDASSAVSVAVAHVTAPPPTEAMMAERMSPALAAIVSRLLQKDSAYRFQSAGELAAALAEIATRPDTGWEQPTMMGETPVAFSTPPPRPTSTAPVARPVPVDAARILAGVLGLTLRWLRAAAARVDPARSRSTVALTALARRIPGTVETIGARWIALGAFVLLLAIVSGITLHWQAAPIPLADVRHLPLATAQARLNDAGFSSSVRRVYDAHAPALIIISAGPRPDVIYRSRPSGGDGGD